MARARSWFGWGWADEALAPEAVDGLARLLGERFGFTPVQTPPPAPGEVSLRTSRIRRADIPGSLAPLFSDTPLDRASHTYGKAFRDVARAYARVWQHSPDAVARPRTEQDVTDILDWATLSGAVVVPFGGGSSVVGGVEPDLTGTAAHDRPVVTLDLTGIAGVLELDEMSGTARIAAGTFGPDADAALRRSGWTMRHFPQSYEHSTVGGWVATRAGGHFATGPTRIDDFVSAVRCVTPSGVWQSRPLPGSGAGPSPDRMIIGSEGVLGVITEVWLRLHRRPEFRASASLRFADFQQAVAATRAVVRSGMQPSGCRLLDPVEAAMSGVGEGSAVLLLAFESPDHPVDADLARAVEIARGHGGQVAPRGSGGSDAEDWRSAFLRAPYLRDALLSLGCIAETFETACTWAQFPALHEAVTTAVTDALTRIGGGGQVGMRFTHVYPDGPAPYYTVIAPGRPGDPLSLVAQWDEIKSAASDALLAAGGTITHHHAVGRVHRPWYDKQRPDLFAASLRAVKDTLDPAGIMNPGVLV